MATAASSKKRLALAIIDFLNTSATDGTLAADDAESIEIATNCIAESFKVDPTDSAAMADALGGQNLHAIYSVYEKLKGRTTPSTEGPSSAKEARPSTPTTAAKDADKKQEADRLKGLGNAAMQQKDYETAIAYYTQALDLVPLNPIFLSNRAAAYSGAGKHEEARQDAEMATAADPAYTKAWSRLGLARFALGDAKGSMEAYKKGIEAEGNGGSDAMKRGYETAKRRVEEEEGAGATARSGSPGAGGAAGAGGMPDLSSLASMLGGGGGGQGGQGGGMPDFGALMNNPMLRQMAQNVMSNPQLMQNMLSNPRLREMAEQFGGGAGAGGAGRGSGGGGGGGGMPDFSQMMQDPSIMEMARNLMGGGAGGAGGNSGAGRGAGSQ